MKNQFNVWVVVFLLFFSLWAVSALSGTPSKGLTQAAPSSPQPATVAAAPTRTKPVITPDLTKVDAHEFLDPVPVGKKAPNFSTTDALGKPINLSQYVGKKNVVLVFYQGSFCPVCGRQLENLQMHMKDFANQNAEIIAISADDKIHAQKTLGEHGLSFRVVPDPDKAIIKKFGVGNISKNGIAWPASFIVDKKGIVRLSVADSSGKRLHSSDLLPALSKITGKPAPKLGYEQ